MSSRSKCLEHFFISSSFPPNPSRVALLSNTFSPTGVVCDHDLYQLQRSRLLRGAASMALRVLSQSDVSVVLSQLTTEALVSHAHLRKRIPASSHKSVAGHNVRTAPSHHLGR